MELRLTYLNERRNMTETKTAEPTETRTLPDGREVIITDRTGRPSWDPFRYHAIFPGEEGVIGSDPTPEGAIEALLGHQKYLDALEVRYPGPRRFREWVAAGRPPLTVDDTAVCVAGVKDEGSEDADENGWRECYKRSAFIVERSDEDPSFGELGGGAEACEEHVWETIFSMMDGDDTIRAVVTPRWAK